MKNFAKKTNTAFSIQVSCKQNRGRNHRPFWLLYLALVSELPVYWGQGPETPNTQPDWLDSLQKATENSTKRAFLLGNLY